MSNLCGTGCYTKTLLPFPVSQNFLLCINSINLIKKWILRKKTNPVYLVEVGNPETVFHSLFFSGGTVFIKTMF